MKLKSLSIRIDDVLSTQINVETRNVEFSEQLKAETKNVEFSEQIKVEARNVEFSEQINVQFSEQNDFESLAWRNRRIRAPKASF